jgi:hypothetical protein
MSEPDPTVTVALREWIANEPYDVVRAGLLVIADGIDADVAALASRAAPQDTAEDERMSAAMAANAARFSGLPVEDVKRAARAIHDEAKRFGEAGVLPTDDEGTEEGR